MSDDEDTARQPTVDAEGRRQRRINAVVLPVVLVLTVAMSVLAVAVAVLYQQNVGLSKALTAQCQQTKKLGHTCVAAPAASVRANPGQPTVSAQPGPSGPAGRNGVNGSNGVNGVNGSPGLSITSARLHGCDLLLTRQDGLVFDAGNVCGPAGSVGPSGPAGQNGQNGANGQDGQPGPAGSTGPAGQDGQPPASYAVEDPDGTTYECTRDAGSPDDAPTYTCQPASSPSPSPSTLVRLH